MTRHEEQTIVEIVLYILNKTRGLDMYHLFKVMYFAERSYLALYGRKMTKERYFALQWGPVPSFLYDAIKEQGTTNRSSLGELLWNNIKSGDEVAKNYLFAERPCNSDYIPEAAIKAIDESIEKYASMTFSELTRLSHGKDWRRAMEKTSRQIDPIDTALTGGADESVIEYLREELDWDKTFN